MFKQLIAHRFLFFTIWLAMWLWVKGPCSPGSSPTSHRSGCTTTITQFSALVLIAISSWTISVSASSGPDDQPLISFIRVTSWADPAGPMKLPAPQGFTDGSQLSWSTRWNRSLCLDINGFSDTPCNRTAVDELITTNRNGLWIFILKNLICVYIYIYGYGSILIYINRE